MADVDVVPIAIGVAAVGAVGVGLYLLSQQPPVPPGTIATSITIAAAPNPVDVGVPVTISGVLMRTDLNQGIPGRHVSIEQSLDQIVWQELTTVQTAADGSYAVQVAFPAAGTYYVRSRFAGGAV